MKKIAINSLVCALFIANSTCGMAPNNLSPMTQVIENMLRQGTAIPVDMQFSQRSADTLAAILPQMIQRSATALNAGAPEVVQGMNALTDGYQNNIGRAGEASAGAIRTTGGAIEAVGKNLSAIGLTFSATWVAIGAVGVVGTAVALKYVKKYAYEPKLIEKQSSPRSWFSKPKPVHMNLSDHMVISDALKKDLELITATTQNVKLHGGEFDHILLHGEPGTGKTLFAQILAQNSGMDYAIVPAANVSQFLADKTIVEKINDLFSWAEKQPNGTIIFFDEAETFLADRKTLSFEANNALAALLAKTGTPSKKVMVICATNRPEIIDRAVLSRLGEQIHFPLPDQKARYEQLVMHSKKTFEKEGDTPVQHACLQNQSYLEQLAEDTEGLSGRSLQKIINKSRQTALANGTLVVTQDTINEIVNKYKKNSLAAAAAA